MRIWKSPTMLLLAIFSCILFTASAQQTTKGNTYAIVIGISGYQDASIPQLSYADKDAKLFAEWLQSKPGGKVNLDNIKLLTNENATISAVYNALDWVKEKANSDDIVYIYFSGHGDVETRDSTSQGYLLAWNSPPNNYRNNALSVSDLNTIANTLTTQNNAKVILITDACHSGKLAGDFFKGKQFTAHNLNKILNNQVRLASCKENEEAAEGPAWGGGRGVFSYYLLMGLNGKAGGNEVVRLKALQSFIDSAFKNDQELKLDNHIQNPVLDGNDTFQLAIIDSATIFAIKNGAITPPPTPPNGLQSLRTIDAQPMDYFFALMKGSYLENELDFNSYYHLSAKDIPAKMVQDCIKSRQKLLDKIESEDNAMFELYQYDIDNQYKMEQHFDTLKSALDSNKLNKLLKQFQENRFLASRFNEKLVQTIQGKAQDMINAYLKGDISELEKRQYYYSGNRNYRNFLPMLKTAIHLTPESNYLHDILQINEAYLAGVIDRLEIATHQKETDSLLKSAFANEFRAMQLEPYAAYIHNELGNLYFQKHQYDSAAYHYNFASLLAPTWAIPWSNKIRLNLAISNLSKAKEAILVADSLEPNLAYVNTNAGLVMEKDGNLLAAESYYLKAIAQNGVHFLPFERLGYIYIQTGDYAKADSFLYEAAQRKDKFAVNDAVFLFGIGLGGPGEMKAAEHYINECKVPYDSAVAGWNTFINLATGIFKISDSSKMKSLEGEEMIKKALANHPNIPLANHYLGKIYYENGNWQKAETKLKKACSNFKSSVQLKSYLKTVLSDSLRRNASKKYLEDLIIPDLKKSDDELISKGINRLVDSSCLLSALLYLNYDELEDYYMLASIYEKRGFTVEAIAEYRTISDLENIKQMNQAMFVGYFQPETPEDLKNITQPEEPSHTKTNQEVDSKISAEMKAEGVQQAMELNLIEMNDLIYKYNNPIKMGGTIKAARLYEQIGQYENAEKILLQQVSQNRAAGFAREEQLDKKNFGPGGDEVYNYYWLNINKDLEMETYNFYARMTTKFPRDTYWYKKAGAFLYNRLALTYDQIPLEERYSFYKYSLAHAYPFAGGIEGPNEIQSYNPAALIKTDNVFFLPVTKEKIEIDTSTYDPVMSAIYYLQQSIRFSGDLNPDPAVLESIADLQSWMNNSDSAISKYEYLIALQPKNATPRNKLIDNLVLNKNFPQACIQLESLYKSHQIRHGQLLQLAEYQMLQNKIDFASKILNDFIPKNEHENCDKFSLLVKQYTILKKPKTVLKYINEIIQPAPTGDSKEDDNAKEAYSEPIYTQARAYAMLGKNKEALITLKNMIDSGNKYQYLLKSDHAWDKLRNTQKWKTLIHARPFYDVYNKNKYQIESNDNTVSFRIPTLKKKDEEK